MSTDKPEEFLLKIRDMKSLLGRVLSGKVQVGQKEGEYSQLQRSLITYFEAFGIPNPNNFESLVQFHGYYRSKMQTDEQRKNFVNRLYEQSENQLRAIMTSKKQNPSTKKRVPKMIYESRDARKIFVVHGRNEKARVALFTFLRAVGLQPLEWTELLRATESGSPYIGDVLEKGFAEAQAVVVLMTPDDEGKLRDEFKKPSDGPSETELTPQARLNVIFEAGMAFGYCPDRTIIIEITSLRSFSDISGRHVLRFHEKPEKRHELVQRLLAVGCAVNNAGTDWLSAGDFTVE